MKSSDGERPESSSPKRFCLWQEALSKPVQLSHLQELAKQLGPPGPLGSQPGGLHAAVPGDRAAACARRGCP